MTVCSLARNPADHVHRRVRIRFRDRLTGREPERGRAVRSEKGNVFPVHFLIDPVTPPEPFCLIQPVISAQPRITGNHKAQFPHSFFNRRAVPFIYISGSGSALDRMGRPRPKQRHAAAGLQWQYALIFQEDNSLLCRLPGNCRMLTFPCLRYLARRAT